MDEVLERRFAEMGARVSLAKRPWNGSPRIDVRGGVFDIAFTGTGMRAAVEVIDVDPRDRHLLLLVRNEDAKSKFLCGHDERHWFVAAVPESARGVTGVASAKLALQPEVVQLVAAQLKDRFRRRNAAYVRQGEWFFVPAPAVRVADHLVLRNEPLTRGRGKAHVLQYAYRTGGTLVYANWRNQSGISEPQFARLPADERKRGNWTRFARDPDLYAKGTVRHPDHATITLPAWHRVLMNTEQRAQAMQHVAFLD
jgi:hypothetical protein